MRENSLKIAINAGKYKGKKISLPSLSSTRSTKSILKNSFFNTLQADIIGVSFIEMFGGSGSMGLEALSRGAKEAYFIEKDFKALKILEKNCINIDKENTNCFQGDAFSEIFKILKFTKKPTILYVDPPFEIEDENVYEKTIKTLKKIDPNLVDLIVIEHLSKAFLPKTISSFTLYKTKKFGKSSLTYYK